MSWPETSCRGTVPSTSDPVAAGAGWRHWRDRLAALLPRLPVPRLAAAALAAVAVLASVLFLLGPALARPVVIGELATVIGQPTLHRGDGRSPRVPRPSTSIHFGDRLETGDADRVEIRFLDGTTLRLGFNTAVAFPAPSTARWRARFARSEATPAPMRPSEVRLLRGEVWTRVQTQTNAAAYAIHTEAATAIARGTEFGVRLRPLANPASPTPPALRHHPDGEGRHRGLHQRPRLGAGHGDDGIHGANGGDPDRTPTTGDAAGGATVEGAAVVDPQRIARLA